MGYIIAEQLCEASQSNLRYVYRYFLTFVPTLDVYNEEIFLGKVYFNARFDDVRLVVKCEMASVLEGPTLAALWAFTMFTSLIFHHANGGTNLSSSGKLAV